MIQANSNSSKLQRPHRVAVLVLDGAVAFDFATPCEVFRRAGRQDGRAAYEVRLCAAEPKVSTHDFEMQVPWGLGELRKADTVVVPGVADPLMVFDAKAISALRAAAARGARIASICTGAFVLGAAGLLDGLRATTHWLAAAQLGARYPKVEVDANVLFIDNGQILSSAGAAAGLDLCLHMVRLDHGAAVAAEAARLSVMPLQRDGGQAQFIVHEPPASPVALQPLLGWMSKHLDQPLALEAIARRAGVSTRTLSRRFLEQTGTTPLQWVLRARVLAAQRLLETTSLSIEHVATACGFGSSAAFRARFAEALGTPPQRYRQAFQERAPARAQHPRAVRLVAKSSP